MSAADGGRSDLPPTARPVSIDPFEPALPEYIPIARPLRPPWLEYAPPPLAPRSTFAPRQRAWRALFELVMLIPTGFFGAILAYIGARALGVKDQRWLEMVSTAGTALAAMCTAALFVMIDGHPAASIGWTARRLPANIGIGVLTLATTYAVGFLLAIAAALLVPGLGDQGSRAERAVRERMPQMSTGAMIVMLACVAIWEEVVFRGFLLTRLRSLLGRWWLAVPVSAVIFGSVHTYQGPFAVVAVTILGLIMGILFIRRRSLVPCITMHFLHDTMMLLAMRRGWTQP